MNIITNEVRNKLQICAYQLLCAIARPTIRENMPPLPSGTRVCRVIGGALRGMNFANPRRQRSPAFIRGAFEPHVTNVMRRHIRPGSVVYDIGANVGYHTLFAAQCTGTTGKVYCFEPNTSDIELLRWNLLANNIDNAHVITSAISSSSGTVDFAVFDETSGVHHIAHSNTPADARIVSVPSVSLDDFIYKQGHEPPHFIKVDVEGSELAFFEGAERVLVEARPTIVVEMWAKNYDPIMCLIAAAGYQAKHLYGGGSVTDVLLLPTTS